MDLSVSINNLARQLIVLCVCCQVKILTKFSSFSFLLSHVALQKMSQHKNLPPTHCQYIDNRNQMIYFLSQMGVSICKRKWKEYEFS